MSKENVASGKKRKGAGCLRWLGRVALWGLILLLVLVATGAIYQGIASARDAKLYKPVDQMVDVDGIQLRLDCRGSGSPTVVLESGAQSYSVHWWLVQEEVAKFTRVCSYDRPGYGWSDPAPAMTSSQEVATLLHSLLATAGEGPPYLMVGHSMGGVFVRAFAVEYPDEVVGMVLVDSSHEQQALRTPAQLEEVTTLSMELQNKSLPILKGAASIGVLRATGYLEPNVAILGLPEAQSAPVRAQVYRTDYFRSLQRELVLMEVCMSQPGALNSLGNMPLIVLSAVQDARANYEAAVPLKPYLESPSQLTLAAFQEDVEIISHNQEELAALSTRSRHIVVKDSGHFIQLEKPQVVIDAIRDVFEQVPK